MSILDELQLSSFKGVPFIWKRLITTSGRDNIQHKYPNRDIAFIEDLSGLSKEFTISAGVEANNYFTNRNNFINALDSKGPGLLSHPSLGDFNVSVIGRYSLEEKLTNLGSAAFTITFKQTELNIFPIETTDNSSNIISLGSSVSKEIFNNLENNYNTPNTFTLFKDVKNKITNFIDDIEIISKQFNQVSDNINNFANKIINFRKDINDNINSVQGLALSINDLFETAQAVITNPLEKFTFLQHFFTFGNTDTSLELITENILNQDKNRKLFNQTIQANALVGAYQNSITITFNNNLEINNIIDILENQYTQLLENDINNDIKILLDNLRNGVILFFENLLQITSKIKEININTIPITPFIYKFYGALDNTENIINLNKFKELSFIQGNVKVLTN